VTDGLSGVGPPPTLTISHVFAIWMYPGAAAVASAQNATSEDPFVKSSRSLDVRDGEKVRDGEPILRRHLIVFLLDLDFTHGRLPLGYGILRSPECGRPGEPDYFAFLFSVSIRSLAAGPDEAGFWPVISWPSVMV
jgi:hypothetical protein